MIRLAEDRDIETLVDLCHDFYTDHPVRAVGYFDPSYNRTLLQGFIHAPDGCVYVAETEGEVVGLAAMIIMPTLFHPTARMAHEIIWYMTPDRRLGTLGMRLFDAIEAWATRQNVQGIVMVTVGDDARVVRLYERRGYTRWESSYVKVLEA